MSVENLHNLNFNGIYEIEPEQIAELGNTNANDTNLYTIKNENEDIITQNGTTGNSTVDKAVKRINQLLTKITPFKSEDSTLNTLLNSRSETANELLGKKSELANEDDPQKRLEILREIEKIIEKDIEKNKKILEHIEKNSDYDFVSPCLKDAIKKYEKALESFKKENDQKEKDLNTNNASNASNASNADNAGNAGNADNASNADNADGAGGADNNVDKEEEKTDNAAEEAALIEEKIAQMNFGLPKSNLEGLDSMTIKDMELRNEQLDGNIAWYKGTIQDKRSDLGDAITTAEASVATTINEIANAIGDTDKTISSLTSTHEQISSEITDTRSSIGEQKTSIQTAQDKIQSISSGLADLVVPDKAMFTHTTTTTDKNGKTVTESSFDQARYNDAYNDYNIKKNELNAQLDQAKKDLEKAKEEKAKLELKLDNLYTKQQETEEKLITACKNNEKLSGFADDLDTASKKVTAARGKYTETMAQLQTNLEQLEANKIELATKLNEKREFARVQEEKLLNMNNEWELAKNEQGILGDAWNWIKNVAGHENGSDAIDKKIQALNEKATNGEEITQEELNDLQETINNYRNKQDEAVNEQSKNLSGTAAGAAGGFLGAKAGAAIGTAIFPGAGTVVGGLIGFGIGAVAGFFVGGAANVGLKQAENMTDDVKGNSWKSGEMQEDAKEGALNGFVSGGLGGVFGMLSGAAKATQATTGLADDALRLTAGQGDDVLRLTSGVADDAAGAVDDTLRLAAGQGDDAVDDVLRLAAEQGDDAANVADDAAQAAEQARKMEAAAQKAVQQKATVNNWIKKLDNMSNEEILKNKNSIKKEYRGFVKLLHSDRYNDLSGPLREEAEELMKNLNASYDKVRAII